MTKRGYTIDPNKEASSPDLWHEAPLSHKRYINHWAYLQDYEVVPTEVPAGTDIGALFGGGFSNICASYPDSQPNLAGDSGDLLMDPSIDPLSTDGIRIVDHIFATVKVVDNETPVFSDPNIDFVTLGEIAIDSDEQPVARSYKVDPASLEVYDGWLISDPAIRPVNLDGGPFFRWGQGDVYDGAEFKVVIVGNNGEPTRRQDIEFEGFQTYDNNDLLNSEGDAGVNDLLITDLINRHKLIREDRLLGRINYETIECTAVITDWSHYNWHDDRPVRKAFKALVKNLPDSITDLYVALPQEVSPSEKYSTGRAFWISLGFEPDNKSGALKYNLVKIQSY